MPNIQATTPIDRFNIFVDFDGCMTVEFDPNGDFVKAEDAPGCQRVNVFVWNSCCRDARLEVDDDDDGEWVRFEDIF